MTDDVAKAELSFVAAKARLKLAKNRARTKRRRSQAKKAGVNEWLGEVLRELRHESEMTQQSLADAIGLSRAAVTNIEASRCDTTVRRLVAICEVFSTDPNTLLGYE